MKEVQAEQYDITTINDLTYGKYSYGLSVFNIVTILGVYTKGV